MRIDSLTEYEKKTLMATSSDFYREHHDHLEQNISRRFHTLWERHDAFGDFIFKAFPKSKNDFDLTPVFAKNLLKNLTLRKDLLTFLRYLQEANRTHGCMLNIGRVDEKIIEHGFVHEAQNASEIFEINGSKSGKEGTPYDSVGVPQFSPDGSPLFGF